MASFTPKRHSVQEKLSPEEKLQLNLMTDRRVFRGHVHNLHNIKHLLSPQEQEQLFFQEEKDRKQLEQMRTQIEIFKKTTKKKTPYDLRPAPPPRLPVDLQFFLTDQRLTTRSEIPEAVQTDRFRPPPSSPPYIPKKTGIDSSTQVWDGELFSFDLEVIPIVNVLAAKTIEESLQEIEEEAEIIHLKQALSTHNQNLETIRLEDLNELDLEQKSFQEKQRFVKEKREKYDKNVYFNKKLQDIAMSKTINAQLIPCAINKLLSENTVFSKKEQLIKTHYKDWLVSKITSKVHRDMDSVLDGILCTAKEKLVASRRNKVALYKEKAYEESLRNINFSKDKRLLSFLFFNDKFEPHSEFKQRLEFKLAGKEYIPPPSDKALLTDEVAEDNKSNVSVEDDDWELPQYRTIQIDSMKSLSFCLANHPFLDIPKGNRKYSIHCEAYSESKIVHQSYEKCKGLKHVPKARNYELKHSDDEKLIIELAKIPSHIHSLLLYVAVNEAAPDARHARYHLDDYSNSQFISYKEIQNSGNYLAYRIYRQEENPRTVTIIEKDEETVPEFQDSYRPWFLDIYNREIQKPLQEVSGIMKELVKEGYDYIQDFKYSLIDYRTSKFVEFKNFLAKKEAIEAAALAKGQTVKLKLSSEPKKMTEYIPSSQPVSRPFGPFAIDLNQTTIEDLRSNVFNEIAELNFQREFEILVGKKVLRSLRGIKRAKTLFDLRIREEPLPEVVPAEDVKENEDDEEE